MSHGLAAGARLTVTAIATLAAALSASGCRPLPAATTGVVEQADQFEVLTLEPYAPPEATGAGAPMFHGHLVTWRAEIKDRAVQQMIWGIVDDGLRASFATQAKCFNPRHGIHAVRAGRVVDLAICYQCANVEVHDGETVTLIPTGDVQDRLDWELRFLGAPDAARRLGSQ